MKTDVKIVLVSGGCGLAALYQIAKEAKESNDVEVFIGAKDKNHLFYVNEANKISKVHVATDDGSQGKKGFVTQLIEEKLEEMKDEKLAFFNCGPEPMIDVANKIQEKYAPKERIFNSIDYVTKCGVGICGSCATKDGRRLCVDGPFLDEKGDKNEN